jgi:hypothetical protein
MTRILALLLLVVLLGLAARLLLLRARRSPLGQLVETIWRAGSAGGGGVVAAPRSGEARVAGALVRCPGCGVHVPVERMLVSADGVRLCHRCADPGEGSSSK